MSKTNKSQSPNFTCDLTESYISKLQEVTMSKRENLRLRLADAIERVLGSSHELTLPNCLRYVRPHLHSFSIRDTTIISLEDWETSIELATLRLAKPTDQPTPFVKSLPIPRQSTDWKEYLLNRLNYLHSDGVIPKKEYDIRMRLLDESFTKENYFDRLKSSVVIASGT